MDRCHEHYPAMGGEYRSSESRWHFPSKGYGIGPTIKLSHMQHENDKYNHQGAEYQFLGFDEATQFSKTQYLYLHSRARTLDPSMDPIVRATTNPGGVGHVWVKERFVTIGPWGKRYVDPVTGLDRCFIPGRLTDNPSLLESDPLYIQKLMLLPENEQAMLIDGSWDTFEGQAFPELSTEVHQYDYELPPEWEYFRTADWGHSKPYCILWWAHDFDGNLYVYDELYGNKSDEDTNIGAKQTAIEVARLIHDKEREMRVKVKDGPGCREMWARRKSKKDGLKGPTVQEEFADEKIVFLRPDHDRIQGKHQVHNRLRIDGQVIDIKTGELLEDGSPSLYIHKRCKHLWRTLPELPLSETNPEDVDDREGVEDHAYESLRLGLMSRPLYPKESVRKDTGSFQAERRKLIMAKKRSKRLGIPLSQAYRR